MRRIEALDGWRAISAALVIVSHLQGFSAVRFSLPISNYGNLGVQYFFGISGFVIARGLLQDQTATFGGFYVRRIFRILPPLLIYIGVVVALVMSGVLPKTALGAGEGIFFVCNLPWGDCGGWFGGHLWSLSVEEQFYLVCPFIVLATRSRRVITLAMSATVLGAFALRLFHLSDAAGVATQFTVIATGVACAANEERLVKLTAATPAWLAAVGFLASVALLEVNTKVLTSALHIFVLGPLVMFVLLSSSMGRGAPAWLKAPWLTSVGVATYSIYLFQQLATYAYPGAGLAFYVFSVGLCVAWGLASYRFIERPLIGLGRTLAVAASRNRSSARSPAVTLASGD